MRWLDGIADSMDLSLSKLGGSGGQGSQACCSPWGYKESDRTERRNNTELIRLGFPVGLLSKEFPFFSYFAKSYSFSLIKNKFFQCFLCIYCHDHMALPI